MNKQRTKAFTLVELIVVITILAILGTIAFISLQGYAQTARDSSRISDMKSISKTLELFTLQNGSYPLPQDGIEVTYTGATVWTQGNFGEETRAQLGNRAQISTSPLDPLTGSKYTYSVLNTGTEYQIGGILEGTPITYSPINQTNAGTEIASAYITGNYNGSLAKVSSGSTDYILAVPSIINGDMSLTDVIQIMTQKKIVYRGYKNLPASFSGTVYNTAGEPTLTLVTDPVNNLVVYSGSTQDLTNPADLKILADNLQSAYSGTTITNNAIISNILSVDTDNSTGVNNTVGTLVNNNVGEDIVTIVPSDTKPAPSSYTCIPQIIDYSSAYNDNGGFYNSPYYPPLAFAAIKADGSIINWGHNVSGIGTPLDTGYVKIYGAGKNFAALKSDGSITSWWDLANNGSSAPGGTGYTKIASNSKAFAALKSDGTVTSWGNASFGGTGAPGDSGYTDIFSTSKAFAAIKADGSISSWGDTGFILATKFPPFDNGYVNIYSTSGAFAAIKADGTISSWGDTSTGGNGAPVDSGYTDIYSNSYAFAAMKADGSIFAWGNPSFGGSGYPDVIPGAGKGDPDVPDNGYTKIFSTGKAFAAIKPDGSIKAWGDSSYGGSGAPVDNGYTDVSSTLGAFAAIKSDGSIASWGDTGGILATKNPPFDNGYNKIYSNNGSFAAIKDDGSISVWGYIGSGGNGGPVDSGYVSIYSTANAFTAIKADGTTQSCGTNVVWGTLENDDQ